MVNTLTGKATAGAPNAVGIGIAFIMILLVIYLSFEAQMKKPYPSL